MNKATKLMLITLALINFSNIMDFMIMMPLGPQLMRIYNIGTREFGLAVSAYTLAAGVSGFCSALWIDKFDRKKYLQVVYIGFLIGTLLCGLSNSFLMLTLARIFTGIFGGILGAIILAIVGDTVPFEFRGRAMGMIMMAFSVASVFGVPFGLWLANQFNWQAPFLFLFVMAMPVMWLIYKFIPALGAHVQDEKSGKIFDVIRLIMASKNQRKAITLMMVIMFGHFITVPFISPYMVSNVGFTEAELSYIYLFGGLSTIVSSPLIGKMADKMGKLKVFTWFVALSTIPVLLITNMPRVEVWIALLATTMFFAVSSGRFIPAQAMVTATVHPENRGGFMSIVSSMQQLSAGLASYLGGLVVTKANNGELMNYNWVGAISVIFAILSLYLVRRITAADGSGF